MGEGFGERVRLRKPQCSTLSRISSPSPCPSPTAGRGDPPARPRSPGFRDGARFFAPQGALPQAFYDTPTRGEGTLQQGSVLNCPFATPSHSGSGLAHYPGWHFLAVIPRADDPADNRAPSIVHSDRLSGVAADTAHMLVDPRAVRYAETLEQGDRQCLDPARQRLPLTRTCLPSRTRGTTR